MDLTLRPVLLACQFYGKFILPPVIFGVNSIHSVDNLFQSPVTESDSF